jgi:hypothetical protein
LLVVGWSAVTNRKPAAPLSNTELNRASDIKQEVPFGPASLGPNGSAGTAVKPAQPSVSVDAAVPVPHVPAASAAPPQAKPKSAKHARKHVRPTAAEDDKVVVRHFGAPAPKMKTDINAGLKRYSDLEFNTPTLRCAQDGVPGAFGVAREKHSSPQRTRREALRSAEEIPTLRCAQDGAPARANRS